MTGKRPALGRGLTALLPTTRTRVAEEREPREQERELDAKTEPPPGTGIRFVPLGLLDAGRRQPRKRFDDAPIRELADSIRQSGILQPVLVTRAGERFRILAGERRVRAAGMAGLESVPCLVKEGLADRDELLLALVENVQREDLSPLEEAEAFLQLREEFGFSQEEIATRVGKDRTTVANALRLLKLPARVRLMVEDKVLTAGHARALLGLSSAEDQETLANEVAKKGLSVRQAEHRVSALAAAKEARARKEKAADPDTRDAERRLATALGTKVEITRRKKGGELRITFFSESDLIRLFDQILAASRRDA